MRVLLVSGGSGSRGGGEGFLEYLGMALTDRGHKVLMWIPNHERMDELATRCARFSSIIRSHYTNTYNYSARSLSTCFNWGTSRRIASEWDAIRPDVIHINKQNLEDGLDLLRAARFCVAPSLCTVHLTHTATYLRAKIAWLRDTIAYWQLRKFDGPFVAVQDQRAVMLREFLKHSVRVETVLNGVPRVDRGGAKHLRDSIRKELGVADQELLVLGVGRLVAQKRPSLFLRIAKELHERISTTKFVWVGDGILSDQWSQTVATEGLDKTVFCVGWQPNILPYLMAADLLLHVAEFEGLPLAVIEAMAAGLPCAVTHNICADIPLFNAENVLLADDVGKLAESLRIPSELARLSDAGIRLVDDRLSADQMAACYERLYTDLIVNKSSDCELGSLNSSPGVH
jgi:glycosyltransferase involved in cell wall biosynthesis